MEQGQARHDVIAGAPGSSLDSVQEQDIMVDGCQWTAGPRFRVIKVGRVPACGWHPKFLLIYEETLPCVQEGFCLLPSR